MQKNTYHFSVDDVFNSLIEVADKKIKLLEQPFFAFLKELHQKYNTNVSLYLFFEWEIDGKLRSLKEVPNLQDQLAMEPWLSFGPHALSYKKPPYDQTPSEQIETFDKIYKEIERFAGKSMFSEMVRLQYYSESFELAEYFHSKGVKALFTTDRPVGSYRMPKEVAQELLDKGTAVYNNLNFIRTMYRVEFFAQEDLSKEKVLELFQNAFEKYGFLIFYSHEIDMVQKNGMDMARLMFDTVKILGLESI